MVSALMCVCVFFFFKQKTAYEMRISDGVQTCALPIFLATIAASGLSVAFAGWVVRPLTAVERLAFALASLVTLWPTPVDATDPLTLAARMLGLTVLEVITFRIAAGTARPLPGATKIGRAHVRTPVTNAHLVCSIPLENKNKDETTDSRVRS